MKLTQYLDNIQTATTIEMLEAALSSPYKHSYRGPIWSRICNARVTAGLRIAAQHPLGHLVPRIGPGRRIYLAGESYLPGRGGNASGCSYTQHATKAWAEEIFRKHGLSQLAAHRVWQSWRDYPHRCLATLEASAAGLIPDPVLDTLIWDKRPNGFPIAYTTDENDTIGNRRRATKPCRCGGALFDWGAGSHAGFDFINWHCNACPDVATEYLSHGRLSKIRSGACDTATAMA